MPAKHFKLQYNAAFWNPAHAFSGFCLCWHRFVPILLCFPSNWFQPTSTHVFCSALPKYIEYRSTDIENRVIVTHHLGISISKNRQTILNIRISNTIYYGQPIKARNHVQVFHNTLAILKFKQSEGELCSIFQANKCT